MKKYSYNRSKINRKITKTVNKIQKFHWKYRNLILLLISFVVAYFILSYKPISSFVQGFAHLGYLAAFILGMLFTYALTAVPATAALYNLGGTINPFLIALIGALGSVLSDYLIFRFVKDRLMDEIKLFVEEVNNLSKPISDLVFPERMRVLAWKKISKSRIWKYLIPVMAGFIIASPLPDELGVAIFGATKYEPKKFLIFSYCANFIGIFAIASLAVIL